MQRKLIFCCSIHTFTNILCSNISTGDLKYLKEVYDTCSTTRKWNQTNKWDFRKKENSGVMMHSERTLSCSLVTFTAKWLDFYCCNYSNMGQVEIQSFSFLSSLAGSCSRNSEGRVILPFLSHTHNQAWREWDQGTKWGLLIPKILVSLVNQL